MRTRARPRPKRLKLFLVRLSIAARLATRVVHAARDATSRRDAGARGIARTGPDTARAGAVRPSADDLAAEAVGAPDEAAVDLVGRGAAGHVAQVSEAATRRSAARWTRLSRVADRARITFRITPAIPQRNAPGATISGHHDIRKNACSERRAGSASTSHAPRALRAVGVTLARAAGAVFGNGQRTIFTNCSPDAARARTGRATEASGARVAVRSPCERLVADTCLRTGAHVPVSEDLVLAHALNETQQQSASAEAIPAKKA
jgi:hypothetical protein